MKETTNSNIFGLSDEAKKARSEYWKAYRESRKGEKQEKQKENVEPYTQREIRRLEKRREWQHNNREKCREYERRYWERKAAAGAE